MKYYSDILNKIFDSEAECLNAEKIYKDEQVKRDLEKREKASLISKEKKELADAIESAEAKVSKAYENYEIAKEKVKEILEKSNKEALSILNPAKQEIKDAQKERYTAISEFNKKFGTYTKQYTGTKAYEEFKRATSWIEDFLNNWF